MRNLANPRTGLPELFLGQSRMEQGRGRGPRRKSRTPWRVPCVWMRRAASSTSAAGSVRSVSRVRPPLPRPRRRCRRWHMPGRQDPAVSGWARWHPARVPGHPTPGSHRGARAGDAAEPCRRAGAGDTPACQEAQDTITAGPGAGRAAALGLSLV